MATHGSLTKAGKVRGQTPKVEGRKIVGDSSSVANKSNFKKTICFGQISWSKQTWSKKKTTIVVFVKIFLFYDLFIKRHSYKVLVPYYTVW